MYCKHKKEFNKRIWDNCIQISTRLISGKVFDIPKLYVHSIMLKESTPGYYDRRDHSIHLDSLMVKHNPKVFYDFIIPHEVAHAAEWAMWGGSGHGDPWRHIMFFGLDQNPEMGVIWERKTHKMVYLPFLLESTD